MPFQLSPGVLVTEKDITLIVPAVATSPAAIVCPFAWGPANEVTTVSSEADLVATFGAPKNSGYYSKFWLTASNFLAYGNNLKVVRYVQSSTYDRNASSKAYTSSVSNPYRMIANQSDYDTQSWASTDSNFWAAYPGTLGNGLKVVVLDSGSGAHDAGSDNPAVLEEYADYMVNFDSLPGTSQFSKNLGNTTSKDEIHVLVIDGDGTWTGVAGTVLEKFAFLSKASNGLKEDGTSSYYRTVINNESKYLWVGYQLAADWDSNITTISSAFTQLTSSYTIYTMLMTGLNHADADSANDAAIAGYYDTYFGDADLVDIGLIIAGPVAVAAAKTIAAVASTRRDCVAFVSPLNTKSKTLSAKLTEVLSYRSALDSSSYAIMDTGYKTQYDKYNDVYRSVPLCGDIAGLCARTDYTNDPWWSPAGFSRGTILNTIKLDYNPNKTHRDELYKKGVNPVVAFDGSGVVLYGDKTMLEKPSAFDRINVRRLFIVLEKAIAKSSQFIMFEFNDEFTRAQFRLLVEPYLRDVAARRGITDFKVVCDTTNNTGQVIDSNSFVADIYIKPNRSINFIQLNFVATPTGLSFEEVVGA